LNQEKSVNILKLLTFFITGQAWRDIKTQRALVMIEVKKIKGKRGFMEKIPIFRIEPEWVRGAFIGLYSLYENAPDIFESLKSANSDTEVIEILGTLY